MRGATRARHPRQMATLAQRQRPSLRLASVRRPIDASLGAELSQHSTSSSCLPNRRSEPIKPSCRRLRKLGCTAIWLLLCNRRQARPSSLGYIRLIGLQLSPRLVEANKLGGIASRLASSFDSDMMPDLSGETASFIRIDTRRAVTVSVTPLLNDYLGTMLESKSMVSHIVSIES